MCKLAPSGEPKGVLLTKAYSEAGLARKESKGVGSTVGYYGTQAWLLGMSAYCVLLTREFWGF